MKLPQAAALGANQKKIVEAVPEHDSRFKRLIGMVGASENTASLLSICRFNLFNILLQETIYYLFFSLFLGKPQGHELNKLLSRDLADCSLVDQACIEICGYK